MSKVVRRGPLGAKWHLTHDREGAIISFVLLEANGRIGAALFPYFSMPLICDSVSLLVDCGCASG